MTPRDPAESSRIRQRGRPGTALLALIALLFGLLWGNGPAGMLRAEALTDGLTRIVVCSPLGTRVLYIDAEGRERPAPSEELPGTSNDCQLCQRLSCSKSPLPTAVAVPLSEPELVERIVPVANPAPLPDHLRKGDPRPRAPPRFLLSIG